jgi:hypothetical protein
MYDSNKMKNLVEIARKVMESGNLREEHVDPRTLPSHVLRKIPTNIKLVDPKTDKKMYDYVLKMDKQRKSEEMTLDTGGSGRGLVLIHVKMPRPDGEYTHAGYVFEDWT